MQCGWLEEMEQTATIIANAHVHSNVCKAHIVQSVFIAKLFAKVNNDKTERVGGLRRRVCSGVLHGGCRFCQMENVVSADVFCVDLSRRFRNEACLPSP